MVPPNFSLRRFLKGKIPLEPSKTGVKSLIFFACGDAVGRGGGVNDLKIRDFEILRFDPKPPKTIPPPLFKSAFENSRGFSARNRSDLLRAV